MNASIIRSSQATETQRRRYLLLILFAVFLISCFAPTIIAQDDDPDAAPPPIKAVPKTEKDTLASEPSLKDWTKTSLEMMDGHIAAAEKLSTAQNANAAFKELGMFEALVDDSVTYLGNNDTHSNKTLDALRKLEIGLRGFMPRLETIRRILPLNCDDYVRKLMKNLRDARSKAIDPMFSDTVVRTSAQNP